MLASETGAAAEELRRATGLWGWYPVPVVRVPQALHLRVVTTRFTEAGLRGLIVVDRGERTIYVEREARQAARSGAQDPSPRQRWIIAHELGHYWLHLRHGGGRGFKDFDPQLSYALAGLSPGEREAAAFAAALLVPREALTDGADRLQVAPDVVALRWGQICHRPTCASS